MNWKKGKVKKGLNLLKILRVDSLHIKITANKRSQHCSVWYRITVGQNMLRLTCGCCWLRFVHLQQNPTCRSRAANARNMLRLTMLWSLGRKLTNWTWKSIFLHWWKYNNDQQHLSSSREKPSIYEMCSYSGEWENYRTLCIFFEDSPRWCKNAKSTLN